MRVSFLFAACLTLSSVGCRSTTFKPARESETTVLKSRTVTLPRLADDLGMVYEVARHGHVELTRGAELVVLVPGSDRAVVNGRDVHMEEPCFRMGGTYAVYRTDANLISNTVEAQRRALEPVVVRPPKPPVVSAPTLPRAWRPDVPARRWNAIVVHHTATKTGSAGLLNRAHAGQGWVHGLGYHFVIGNGSLTKDGLVEAGPRWARQLHGAHTRIPGDATNYWNKNSIGIALVGNFMERRPSEAQMKSLVRLVRALCRTYKIPASRVLPHRDVKGTACPGRMFPWGELLARVQKK